MEPQLELSVREWIRKLQSEGKHSFSLVSLKKELPASTITGVKRALSRLSFKGQIISIYKGYYLVIPPQYSSIGILPPSSFVDSFMNFLERAYYMALLTAAAFHGASHHQAQEFFVVTGFPVLRPFQKKGVKMNYISKKVIPGGLLESRKTESGYLKISNPVLTAADLIQFEKRVGGINRAAIVLEELAEAIKPGDFSQLFVRTTPATTLQRLGYLLENVINNQKLSSALYKQMIKTGVNFFRTPLKPSTSSRGFSSDERWKVIINTIIETEE